MKTIRLIATLALLLAPGLFAQVENPDPNGGGSGSGGGCQICTATGYLNSGVTVMSCGSPSSGQWGHEYCSVQSYPEGSYCIPYGNDCCVD